MRPERIRVELLDGTHRREGFDCGVPALNRYLLRQASQDMRRNVGRVYVALEPESTQVVGYYTLSAASIERESLTVTEAQRLPHYPVPCVLLGRLAVDQPRQGTGLGQHLLLDAVYRVAGASRVIGIHALLVDAKNEPAARFYQRYGFVPLPREQRRLFLPLATLQRLVDA